MMPTVEAIKVLFGTLFDRDFVLDAARRVGAVERMRELHPLDVLLSVVCCALGDEHRSIASARRLLFQSTGYMPEESSFYDRLNPGMVNLTWILWLRALAKANRACRRRVARALGLHVRDVRAVDASQVTLPKRAIDQGFPSTNSRHGGFKLTVTLSLLEEFITRIRVTDARQHDRKAFQLDQDVSGVLYLMDRGYSDHRLFADIDMQGGFFLTRLKSSSEPTVRRIHSGLEPKDIGQPLKRQLPEQGVVDVECTFKVGKNQLRRFRVIGMKVEVKRGGRRTTSDLWLVTNLPSEQVSAEVVAQMYRLRWNVENLFRVLKTVGRLDQVNSGNPSVVGVFTMATLLGLALAQAVCAAMRRERPKVEPSLARVFAVLLGQIPGLVATLDTDAFPKRLEQLVGALWREGVNPNPGRPYAWQEHLASVGK
jgi:hypothetical protein